MLPASTRRRSLLLASAAAFLSVPAAAQTSPQSLPPVTVDAPQQKRTAAARPAQPAIRRAAPQAARRTAPTPPANTSAPTATGLETPPGGSLTVPDIAQARAIIDRTPGGVELVPDTAFKNGPANTIKDVLGWVPGVFVQPKWGDDTAAVDPRLRAVAQLPTAACSSTWTASRSTRLTASAIFRDRSDRLPLCRGLQGRQRAALRRQLARWRDQFRHAHRPRCHAVRGARRYRQLRLSTRRRRAPAA